jgi:hypothetical protein
MRRYAAGFVIFSSLACVIHPVIVTAKSDVETIESRRSDTFAVFGGEGGHKLDTRKLSERALANEAAALNGDKKYSESLAIYSRLLQMRPGCATYAMAKALCYRDMGSMKVAIRQLEALIKDIERRGESFSKPYVALAETYRMAREYQKCEQLCSLMLKKFNRVPAVISAAAYQNDSMRSQRLAVEITAARKYLAAHPDKPDTSLARVVPPRPVPLASTEAYELIVDTSCIPRFKCTVGRDRLVGDSGIVKYYVGAPDFNRVTLVNEESNNCLEITFDEMLANFCGRAPDFGVSRVVKVASGKMLGHPCTEYKGYRLQSTSNVTVSLADDILVHPSLAKAINQVCGTPESLSIPLHCTLMVDDYKITRLTVRKLNKVTIAPSFLRPKPGLHKVKNMGELIYAMDGPFGKNDVNDVMKTKIK